METNCSVRLHEPVRPSGGAPCGRSSAQGRIGRAVDRVSRRHCDSIGPSFGACWRQVQRGLPVAGRAPRRPRSSVLKRRPPPAITGVEAANTQYGDPGGSRNCPAAGPRHRRRHDGSAAGPSGPAVAAVRLRPRIGTTAVETTTSHGAGGRQGGVTHFDFDEAVGPVDLKARVWLSTLYGKWPRDARYAPTLTTFPADLLRP